MQEMAVASQADSVRAARAFFEGRNSLPVLPSTAFVIISKLADEFSTIDGAVRVLEKDPVMTARLLGLANTDFLSGGERIDSVRDAISRVLGLDLTRGVALGIALGDRFRPDACAGFDAHIHWSVAVRCAAINRWLGEVALPAGDAEMAYAAGLMAEIGLLALVGFEPRRTGAALERARGGSTRGCVREEFGFDQYDAGQALGDLWDLPAPFVEVVASVGRGDAAAGSVLVRLTEVSLQAARHLMGVDSDLEIARALAPELGVSDRLEQVLNGEFEGLANAEQIATTITVRLFT